MATRSCCPNTIPEWGIERFETPAGDVLRVSCDWSRDDYWGQFRARTSEFRMKYRVQRGLYALGSPNEDSPVLVSGNYKLSFDVLRRALKGVDCWILVLDTRAVNVWCAAGKGTFGTGQLIGRIQQFKLSELVKHRKIVVPQLGAPGISAKEVQERTGFRVYFGPVRAEDIPRYLRDGYKADREMRTVTFTLGERAVLTPMELIPALRKFPFWGVPAIAILGIENFRPFEVSGESALLAGFLALLSVFAGSVLTPLLLPWIPGRSFALKGWITGLLLMGACGLFGWLGQDAVFKVFVVMCFPLASSYIALQFTGSTPFTHFSGVKKELRFAVPVYAAGALITLAAYIGLRLFGGVA